MKLKWYGHSCFLFTNEAGTRLLIDPFNEATGYDLGHVDAEIVCCTHDHFDHNYVEAVNGTPIVVKTAGHHEPLGVQIDGFETYHDEVQGAKRGKNIMYRIEMDGIRLLHAGDLGHMPSEALLKEIGEIDILLVPIGGTYTIDHQGAIDLVHMIRPRVTIPMHYKTPHGKVQVSELAPFLRVSKDYIAHKLGEDEATLTKGHLGENRMLLLEYYRKDLAEDHE